MAGDLGKKVDMILNKLQKLDNIEARLDNVHKSIASLEESFAFLEKDVQNLKDKTEKTRTKVDELEKSVEFREVDISDMPKDLKKVQHEAEELKMQLLYQEHYSRRENLMFPNHVCAMIFKPVWVGSYIDSFYFDQYIRPKCRQTSGDITNMLSRLCQKAGKRNQEDKMLNIFRTTYLCSEGKMLL